MEENRRFSWTNLFIKIILVVIFVLFTVWLLSLSTRGLSDSLDVLTDNIFSQNMEKMKEVGKEYFTSERLPEQVGDVEILTLEEMYDKKLILELTDKNGNTCSAENSYVSVEKYDNEYQMKVYLECGQESDYIIVIMGCYDYCDTDICEFDKNKVDVKEVEYEYKKTTGGKWNDYGDWSEWSKVSVTKTDHRQVETKVVEEEYSYEENVTEVKYASFEASCPSGYEMTSDGTRCYKTNSVDDYESPVCPTKSGWTLVERDGFTCSYVKNTTSTTTDTAVCPSGYTKSGNTCVKTTTSTTTDTASCPSGYTKSGNSCVKTTTSTTTASATCPSGYTKSGNSCVKTTTSTENPVCPTKSGYTLTGRDGFTCSYVKTTTETKNPTCASKSGYVVTRNGFTCTYTRYVKGDYVTTETGEYVPANTSKYIYEEVGTAEYVYDCENGCAFRWIHTYKVYKAKVETTTGSATCPSGYTKSGSTCVKSTTSTTTDTASCPSGYTKSGNSCVKSTTSTKNPTCPTKSGWTLTGRDGFTCSYSKSNTTTKNPVCPTKSGWTLTGRDGFTCNYSKSNTTTKNPVCPTKSGWTLAGRDGFTCNYTKNTTSTTTDTAVCPSGYTKTGNNCLKTITNILYEDLIKSCPIGYKESEGGNNCYKEISSTITVTEKREVTYYRYRLREYVGGSVDYKWSKSKEDKDLLNSGYKLTGRTR